MLGYAIDVRKIRVLARQGRPGEGNTEDADLI